MVAQRKLDGKRFAAEILLGPYSDSEAPGEMCFGYS
jgi:hypothetical protein